MSDSPSPSPRRFHWKTLLAGAVLGMVTGALALAALLLGSYAFFQKAAVTKMAEIKELEPLALRADLNWTVTDLRGAPFDMNRLDGQPLFLHFWTPSCVSCIAEIPGINALYDTFQDRGLAFAAIALHADDALAADVAAHGIRFPVYRGNSPDIPTVFKVRSAPTTYVVDRDGFIVLHHAGAVDWTAGDGHAYLEKVLAD